jgi:hypothetical protein
MSMNLVSPIGTSLCFAALQQFGRFWSEADISGRGRTRFYEYAP